MPLYPPSWITVKFSLLYNVLKYVIKKPQSIQLGAALLITHSCKYDHITPVLYDLRWIPVSEKIKFKIILFTYKALYQQSPICIQGLIIAAIRCLERCDLLLQIRLDPASFNLKSYGVRAFSFSSSELWNKLSKNNICSSVN